MNLSKKQEKILAFAESNYSALICDGAIRSGKTSVMSVAFILWAMKNYSSQNFGLCSKTVQTAERNLIKPILGMAYLKKYYDLNYKRSGSMLEVSARGKTNTFYIYGGKDESSYSLIQGITLAGVLLDEVALMPRSFVEQAIARCSVEGRKLWFNCNPEGTMHWFNQEWIKDPERHNALRLHFTMDDNPSLPEDIKQEYESMYSGVFYERYIKGHWVAAEGIIYDMFDPERHVGEVETEGFYYISSDYGIQNATVFLLWRKERGTNRWACIDEYYYSGRDNRKQKTVAELADDLIAKLDGKFPDRIIVDPSASALIIELKKRGYKTRNANNDVLNGIADTANLLHADRLIFHPRCKNTIEEFSIYSWDEKASSKGEDRPVKAHDHGMDAVRYFVKTMKLSKRDKEPENTEFLYI